MNNRLKTQREWIKNQLLDHGQISRNLCLSRWITRLSGHIYAIKDKNPHWIIDGKWVKTSHGEDYVYTLVNQKKIIKIMENNQMLSA
ncbi:Uncharacterised protein [Campylobacter hyointestinalis subsp. hyointestinalis]|uniref:Uncharacterized protein n=1 Tax=Campylobacter hyointestinalis subsp. hyointestinalis TaxID=91352 RepID=A0A9W5AWL5_CAMHY|nr:hypothetical protein [Campylobacter hyointestinalis]CUU92475.1 Uncharacterised protein [Campylobacter hyointestinalis subsp. hyointestinalis]